jgi:predicted nucleic-acid-binding protein
MKLQLLSMFALEVVGLELRHHANPIRKVVNMLQMMEKKVESEGVKEKELHEKFVCYCSDGSAALEQSVEDNQARVPSLEASIKDGTSRLSQLKMAVTAHKADREEAKKGMSQATSNRERDAKAFKKLAEESAVEITQMKTAIKALEKGLEGSFLQTSGAALKRALLADENLDAGSRDQVLAFLSDSDESPGTSEIVGILKQMESEASKLLADQSAAEKDAIQTYEGLIAAKTKEVKAATKMIEVKLVRVGELEVQIATDKNDLADVEETLAEDLRFLRDLKKNCGQAQELYKKNKDMRVEELAALAETIKLLNDDNALELFKKTLPGPGTSFLQVAESEAEVRARALAKLRTARPRAEIDFIAIALDGKKVGFTKVIGMIDGLMGELKKEQVTDDEKKEYCETALDKADDQKKETKKEIGNLNTNLDDAKEAIAKLSADIEGLAAGIQALDRSVAKATEQRKQESAEFSERKASDSAAIQLLQYAKNRLNKFYNPKLHNPEQSEQALPGSLLQSRYFEEGMSALEGAPPPPPETVRAYKKKGEESQGVISMIDILIADLEKDLAEAAIIEKNEQVDYERMLEDSANKRMADSKSLEDKESARTQTIAAVDDIKSSLRMEKKNLGAIRTAIANIHGDCDFLLKYFDARKEARTNEIESLDKAKAVLNGADYDA